MPRIKDLIQVPEIRTVIRLSDVYDQGLRRSLFQNFVLTGEVADILQNLLSSVQRGKGEGAFIQGHFGCGKSHLLSILSLLLQEETDAWQSLLEQKQALQEYYDALRKDRYLVLDISLVACSQTESLEEIVLRHLDGKIQEQFGENLTFHDPQRFLADMKLLISQHYSTEWEEFSRKRHISLDDIPQASPGRSGDTMPDSSSGSGPDEESDPDEGSIPAPDLSKTIVLIHRFLGQINLPYHLRFHRLQAFDRLGKLFGRHRIRGLIILLDELSEFLNSKKEEPGFHEDIRFLQFLAEGIPNTAKASSSYPIWVIGTVQEYIEDTAQLPQDLFNKIKDRYPLRLSLTGTHIEDLISERLIQKKPGSQEVIRSFYQEYKSAFTTLPISEERFVRLYPVHPATIDLLDDLKSLFSQQRGVVDFIYHQVRGGDSASRGGDSGSKSGDSATTDGTLPGTPSGILEEEAGYLLTADRIFDHFLPRIQGRVETNPYVRTVFKYFTNEIEKILPDPEQQPLGLQIIKILILLAICPMKKKYTVRQIAETLLHKITDLESSINYEYIREILDQLYQKGSYLKLVEKGAEKGGGPGEDVLAIDLEADFHLIVANKLESMRQSVAKEDPRLFYHLGRSQDLLHLPLGRFISQGSWPQTMKWQNTGREGRIVLAQLDEFPKEEFREVIRQIQHTELDFAFLIGPTHNPSNQKEAVFEHLAPAIPSSSKPVVFFWLPAEIEDKGFMRLALCHQLLWEKYSDDHSELGRQVYQYLQGQVEANQSRIKEEFTRAYFGGTIVDGYLQPVVDLTSLGSLAFGRLLDTLITQGLNCRFPRHKGIAPGIEYIQRGIIQEAIDTFLTRGEITFGYQEQQGVRALIEGFLRPMDLVARTATSSFRLRLDTRKNALISHVLSLIQSDQEPFDRLYWLLRKGELGMTRLQFELLSLSLIFGGLLTPYVNQKRKPLDQITIYNLDKITAVGKGELIQPELQALLQELPFLPKKFQGEYSLPLQEEIWEFLRKLQEEEQENILIANSRLTRLEHRGEFACLGPEGLDRARKVLDSVARLWISIDSKLPARQGLSQFLTQYRESSDYGQNHSQNYKLWTELQTFLLQKYDRFLHMYHYLTHPALFIPEERIDLFTLHGEMKELLSNTYLFFSESCFSDLATRFDSFAESYRIAYQKGHQEFSAGTLFTPYEKIRLSRQYLLLKRLSRISYISVKDDLGKVDRMLTAILSQRCPRSQSPLEGDEHVQSVPSCSSCGYQLGQRPNLPPVAGIEALLEAGIGQYLQAFQEEEYRRRIIPSILAMEEIGRKGEADCIRQLLDLGEETGQGGSSDRLFDRLDELLSDQAVGAINEAFLGKVSVVRRNLDQLYENLIDRQFPLEKLQDLFREWVLGGERLEGQTYIKITGDKKKTTDT
ncbi:MAG: DUF6079 family protein [bacterium]